MLFFSPFYKDASQNTVQSARVSTQSVTHTIGGRPVQTDRGVPVDPGPAPLQPSTINTCRALGPNPTSLVSSRWETRSHPTMLTVRLQCKHPTLWNRGVWVGALLVHPLLCQGASKVSVGIGSVGVDSGAEASFCFSDRSSLDRRSSGGSLWKSTVSRFHISARCEVYTGATKHRSHKYIFSNTILYFLFH